MAVNQIGTPPLGGSHEPPEVQVNSEPRKESKPGDNEKKRLLYEMIVLYCVASFVISSVIIITISAPILIKKLASYTKGLELGDIKPKSATPFFYDVPESCQAKTKKEIENLKSLYITGFPFDFHAFLSENETNIDHEGGLVWTEKDLTYGDLESTSTFSTNVSISEVGHFND